jgi:hypothetical protein
MRGCRTLLELYASRLVVGITVRSAAVHTAAALHLKIGSVRRLGVVGT